MASRYSLTVDWSRIEASAPGRIVLTGEFAELYEKCAVAIAIDRRTRVVIKPHKEGKLRLQLKNYDNIREWPTWSFTMTKLVEKYAEILEFNDKMLLRLNHLLHKKYHQSEAPQGNNSGDNNNTGDNNSGDNNNCSLSTKEEEEAEAIRQSDNAAMAFLILYVSLGDSYAMSVRPSLDVVVQSDVPIGRGLGSSSAFAVALCAGLMKVFRVSAEPFIISNWASNIDKFYHGIASGLSTSVCNHGGHVCFQHGKLKALGVRHWSPIKVMLIDTGFRRDPKLINSKVAEQLAEDPLRVNSIFNSINDIAITIWRKFNEFQFAPKSIASHLNSNQELLDALDLGHAKLAEIRLRGHQHKLEVKQTQNGETAFVLYDESDNCRHITGFREDLTRKGYQHENHDICCRGLDVVIIPIARGKVRFVENLPRRRP